MRVTNIDLSISGDRCELHGDVVSEALAEPFTVWWSLPRDLDGDDPTPRGDPFLAALLVMAMKTGEDLEIAAPVSPRLARSAERVQEIFYAWDPTLSKITLDAPTEPRHGAAGPGVGLFFSSGVDSWYSLLKSRQGRSPGEEAITDLIVIHGADIYIAGRGADIFERMLDNAHTAARPLGRRVIDIRTNVRELMKLLDVPWSVLGQGGAMASVGLALQDTVRTIYIATALSYGEIYPDGLHPLLDILWSTESCRFVHDGLESTRLEKVRSIARSQTALERLRVCWDMQVPDYNCGACSKCLRTMLELYVAGALEDCPTLPNAIPHDRLRAIPLVRARELFTLDEVLRELDDGRGTDPHLREVLAEAMRGAKRRMDRTAGVWGMIDALIPLSEPFVLVDHHEIRFHIGAGRRVLQFSDARNDGMPYDARSAIATLERLRREGAKFIVFWRGAFWYLDDQPAFRRHLRSRYPCVTENSSLIAFELSDRKPAGANWVPGTADRGAGRAPPHPQLGPAVPRGFDPPRPGPADQIHLSWAGDPATSLTVTWHTPTGADRAFVEYRRPGAATWARAPATTIPSPGSGVLHTVALTDLQPESEYEYRVSCEEMPAATGIFRTRTAPRAGAADFRFAFLCDTGLIGRLDGNASGTRRVLEEILADDPLFVLGGGDYAYADGDMRYPDVSDAIDAWFAEMQPLVARSVLMAQFGNHEIYNEERFPDWAPRFAHPAGFDDGRNYSFDVGDAHFTALFAAGTPIDSELIAWLDADLRSARKRGARWSIVYQHEPIYAHGRSHPADPRIRQALVPVLQRHRVDLHLSGHDQNYERTYPLAGDPESPSPAARSTDRYRAGSGVIYAKVSPAGKKSDIGNDFSRFTEDRPPFIAARDDTAHHYARVTVRAAGELVVEIFGVRGDGSPKERIDTFRIIAEGRGIDSGRL